MAVSSNYEKCQWLLKQGIEDRDWKKVEEAAALIHVDFFRPEDMACNKKVGSNEASSR